VPGRDEREAWRAFKDPIAKAVGCVDMTARLVERSFSNGVSLLASSANGVPFGPALILTFSWQVEPAPFEGEQVRMTTKRYDYTLTLRTNPSEVVFGWHWHPASKQSHITYPHLHVPSALKFKTRHIPTGRVSLEDVILFGFDDLKVPPAHDDARRIVTEVRERHKQYRSWH
jgi:hypothetical protein